MSQIVFANTIKENFTLNFRFWLVFVCVCGCVLLCVWVGVVCKTHTNHVCANEIFEANFAV